MTTSPPPTPARAATVPCTTCGRLNRVDLARADARPVCGACRAPVALDRPLPVSDASFAKVIGDASVPVIVDFYADWCGPCRAMAPMFEELARRQAGRALVVKLDTERNPEAARAYGIRGIPTLIVFRDGREAARQVGAVPLPQMEALLQQG